MLTLLLPAAAAAGAYQVDYPNGGETLYVDGDVDVRWSGGGSYDSQIIAFSDDAGATYVDLATVGPGVRQATVRMPIVDASDSCLVRVQGIWDGIGVMNEDESDAVFTLTTGFTEDSPPGLNDTQVVAKQGFSWVDYNRDGNLDFFRTGDAGVGSSLANIETWAGDGIGGFAREFFITDDSCFNGVSTGAAFGDFDNDGLVDLFLACESGNLIFRNEGDTNPNGGSAQFSRRSTSAQGGYLTRTVALADYDLDGNLDMFMADAYGNFLIRNQGNFFLAPMVLDDGTSMDDLCHGATWTDYDRDGDPDLLLVYSTTSDRLLVNNGATGFTAQALTSSTGNDATTSASWVDYDNDLDFDLHVLKETGPDELYDNNGGTLSPVTGARGLAGSSSRIDYDGTWRDMSNHGWQEPFIVTDLDARRYLNLGFQGSSNFLNQGGFSQQRTGLGLRTASADYDEDGRLDLYLEGEAIVGTHFESRSWLYRNNEAYLNTNWLQLDLELRARGDAIGAQIEVTTAGYRTVLREVSSSAGIYQGGEPLRQHIGLGSGTWASVKVFWPGGPVSTHAISNVNRIVKIVKPTQGGGQGCPYLYVDDGVELEVANTLLAPVSESAAGQIEANVHDTYALQVQPAIIDGAYEMEIREFEQEHSYFDSIELLAVDHPEGSSPVVTGDGLLALRSTEVTRPISAMASNGEQVLGLVADADGSFIHGKAGDELIMVFDGVDIRLDRRILVVGSSKILEYLPEGRARTGAITRGIEVLIENPATNEWHSLGAIQPRELPSESYLDVTSAAFLAELPANGVVELRLVWHTPHDLDHVSWTRPFEGVPETALLPLTRAEHLAGNGSRVDVLEQVSDADGSFAQLVPGETIALGFDAAVAPPAALRSFVLQVEGHYVRLETVATPETPPVFGLIAARPNPFNPRTTIGFGLPERATAALRVYGLDGRLVRSLVDERLDAGRHEIVWDGRDDAGRAMSSGVYFYRLDSPLGSETRRMTLLK